ncbi:protein serine/threonine phosphatase 2C [Laetiporus sulphureus 93-53]|uniref:Protein serine/threonine phosphatase 2C n=1 Tax=Laetiporus sulphureus 93-53 TaxID=1314785 RepID=A0A165H362_9APHY|nr:protein serine/threonine phosphatase 2C [Laetiporus sulphureus 93-53]KZT11180.1 protein serine/threonine phosphatase 2C [Laetiporus sulphureus 93-53]
MFARLLTRRFHFSRTRRYVRAPPRLSARQASGLTLMSVWGAVLSVTFVGSKAIHLDSSEGVPSKKPSPSARSRTISYAHLESSVNYSSSESDDESLQTFYPDEGTGIYRYDTVQFVSNKPSENEHAEAILPVPSGHWSFFAVFDGHNGPDTIAFLHDNLILATTGALADLYSNAAEDPTALKSQVPQPSSAEIERTIKDTFKRLDHDIVHWAAQRALLSNSPSVVSNLLGPAHAGSCLAFYDSHSYVLHTALTGDSRAVLGRRAKTKNGDIIYEAHALSVEQNGHNLAEEYRLNARHPGEAVVMNGRVLGMSPSRAFGDGRYKWDLDTQRRLKRSYLEPTPLENVKTPPYLTAEPEVTSFEVKPGDFLILGTEGLWECLTNEEVVGLVGIWLKKQSGGVTESASSPSVKSQPIASQEPPVNFDGDTEDASVRYRQAGAQKQFVNVDHNAATHLLRNALASGANCDPATARFSMKASSSHTRLGDITATVVFFTEAQ